MPGYGYGIAEVLTSNPASGGGAPPFEYTPIDNNYSMEFDGLGDYIQVGQTNQSLGITGAITISAWVKFPNGYNGGPNPRYATIIAEDDYGGAARNFWFGFRGGAFDSIRFYVFHNDGSITDLQSTPTVNDGNWHHVLGTYDGTTDADSFKIYIDGVNTDSTTATSTGVRSTSVVGPTIGAARDSSPLYFLQGNIDELAVWNKALSEDTIEGIYNTTNNNPGKVADLTETPEGAPIAWYRFE